MKPMVFPVVIYGYESWITKKAECQSIDAFELWCWRRRLLRVPWTARRYINNLIYADDTTLMAESEEELKEPLDESERGQ